MSADSWISLAVGFVVVCCWIIFGQSNRWP
jgi:hypothetical protein